jgi:hypothetical protein
MVQAAQDFCVKRDDLQQARWFDASVGAQHALAPGELQLRVDRYGLTANNITYALLGDALHYWDFFPAPSGWGRVPVWGYADVVASRVPELPEGDRVYGYLPMSPYLVVRPERISETLFLDASEHRRQLTPTYQQYFRATPGDPNENVRAILRPLYGTGFLLDDWLEDNEMFGARRVLIASASSKTALSAAYTLARHADRSFEIVGLTSARNRAFCTQLGYYDQVLEYAELEALSGDVPCVFIDMAGDAELTRTVHTRFGTALRQSCVVGLTHRGALAPATDLPGPRPTMFFAPERIQKRLKDWGNTEFRRRVNDAQDDFFAATRRWLEIVHSSGAVAIEQTYRAVLDGKVSPAQGHLLSP